MYGYTIQDGKEEKRRGCSDPEIDVSERRKSQQG
jgi:hypothetical protein